MQSHLHFKYSGVIKAINDILHGRVFPLRQANPSLVAVGCIKGKGRSGVRCWSRNRNQSTRNPPAHPVQSV